MELGRCFLTIHKMRFVTEIGGAGVISSPMPKYHASRLEPPKVTWQMVGKGEGNGMCLGMTV